MRERERENSGSRLLDYRGLFREETFPECNVDAQDLAINCEAARWKRFDFALVRACFCHRYRDVTVTCVNYVCKIFSSFHDGNAPWRGVRPRRASLIFRRYHRRLNENKHLLDDLIVGLGPLSRIPRKQVKFWFNLFSPNTERERTSESIKITIASCFTGCLKGGNFNF